MVPPGEEQHAHWTDFCVPLLFLLFLILAMFAG